MTTLAAAESRVRRRIRVVGVVQGVGFRPFVQRLATELALSGHVGNDTEGVLVEIEGRVPSVRRFEERLVDEAPPLARIDRVEATGIDALGESEFRIVETRAAGRVRTFVSPDVAVCDDCLAEMFDPTNRRYRYPFINCTNCGPRFTITVRLPYDRPNTTMNRFPLCSRVRGGVPRTPGSAISRSAGGVRRLRPPPLVRGQVGPRRPSRTPSRRDRRRHHRRPTGAGPRRDRGGEGTRRLPLGLRRHLPHGGGRTAPAQVPGGQAVGRHGRRPGRRRVPGHRRPPGGGTPVQPAAPDRAGPPAAGRAAERLDRAGQSLRRGAVAVYPGPPSPVRTGAGLGRNRPRGVGHDQRQSQRRTHLLPGRRCPPPARPDGRRMAGPRPAHSRAL